MLLKPAKRKKFITWTRQAEEIINYKVIINYYKFWLAIGEKKKKGFLISNFVWPPGAPLKKKKRFLISNLVGPSGAALEKKKKFTNFTN